MKVGVGSKVAGKKAQTQISDLSQVDVDHQAGRLRVSDSLFNS